MAAQAPDWTALRDVVARAKSARAAGTLNRQAFDALWEEAKKAVNGNDEFLESLMLYAPNSVVGQLASR